MPCCCFAVPRRHAPTSCCAHHERPDGLRDAQEGVRGVRRALGARRRRRRRIEGVGDGQRREVRQVHARHSPRAHVPPDHDARRYRDDLRACSAQQRSRRALSKPPQRPSRRVPPSAAAKCAPPPLRSGVHWQGLPRHCARAPPSIGKYMRETSRNALQPAARPGHMGKNATSCAPGPHRSGSLGSSRSLPLQTSSTSGTAARGYARTYMCTYTNRWQERRLGACEALLPHPTPPHPMHAAAHGLALHHTQLCAFHHLQPGEGGARAA